MNEPVPVKREPLPESSELPDEQQGLYRKYMVHRVDRLDLKVTDKHFNCEYFVLDVTHDPFAIAALAAYAHACEEKYPILAADIRSRYKLDYAGLIEDPKQ